MMNNGHNQLDPRDQAAEWFSLQQGRTLTGEERIAFDAWLCADSKHREEYRLLTQIWSLAGKLTPDDCMALAGAPPKHHLLARFAGRRPLMAGMGLACLLIAAIGVTCWAVHQPETDYVQELSTQQGERREIVMPDGSRFALNTATKAMVRYGSVERYVHLLDGEMMLTIVNDQTRPFIIESGKTRVEAGQSRVYVRKDERGVGVAVEQGELRVATGPVWARQSEQLGSGFTVSINDDHIAPMRRLDIDVVAAWTNGQMIFKDERLAVVIAEMNRYLSNPIHVHDEQAANLRIAGVFNLDDVGAFVSALPSVLPVRIQIDARGHTQIVSA
jgi:transmembrane sensor